MKIALIGGTGTFGRGMALRLAANNDVLIGSRDAAKAMTRALELSKLSYRTISGDSNAAVSGQCDAAILAVPETLDAGFLEEMARPLAGKLVISPIVPIAVNQRRFVHALAEGSAAEKVASVLNQSRVAAALHTLPAATLTDGAKKIDFDVLVCANSQEIYSECARIISSMDGLRPLFAGTLSDARGIESLTPLILNVSKLNHLKNLSIKFVA